MANFQIYFFRSSQVEPDRLVRALRVEIITGMIILMLYRVVENSTPNFKGDNMEQDKLFPLIMYLFGKKTPKRESYAP